jgi:hypothetical protein
MLTVIVDTITLPDFPGYQIVDTGGVVIAEKQGTIVIRILFLNCSPHSVDSMNAVPTETFAEGGLTRQNAEVIHREIFKVAVLMNKDKV